MLTCKAISEAPPLKRRIVIDLYDHTTGDEIAEIVDTLRGVGLDPHVEIVNEHERPSDVDPKERMR